MMGVAPRLLNATKDQAIFHQGDRAEAIYCVESGCVRLQMHDYAGHRRVVTFLFPDDLLCAGLHTCWASAHAITESVVAAYPLPQVWAAMSANPQLAIALLGAFDGLQAGLAHQLMLGKASADLRLEWFLDWLSARGALDSPSSLIALPMARRDIADHLGVAPETVSRMFTVLEKRGELAREPRRPGIVLRRGAGEIGELPGAGPAPRPRERPSPTRSLRGRRGSARGRARPAGSARSPSPSPASD